jgi:transposase-like protein
MEKIICTRCSCDKVVKNGLIKYTQRYKCKSCGFNFVIEKKGRGKPESQKRMALHLYLEGMGFRGIGRILKVSNVTVLNWIRSFGEKVKELRKDVKPETVEVMELDEMWHFIQKKRNNVGCGLLMIEPEDSQLPSNVVVGKISQDNDYGKK